MSSGGPPPYSRCKSCGTLMLWCVTLGDRRLPLDPEPVDDGTVLLAMLPDGSVRGRVLTGAELPHTGPGHVYVPHHRTCPGASTHRSSPRLPRALCPYCSTAMDPWLAQHGYRGHVNCLPMTGLREAVEAVRAARTAEAPEALPGMDGAA